MYQSGQRICQYGLQQSLVLQVRPFHGHAWPRLTQRAVSFGTKGNAILVGTHFSCGVGSESPVAWVPAVRKNSCAGSAAFWRTHRQDRRATAVVTKWQISALLGNALPSRRIQRLPAPHLTVSPRPPVFQENPLHRTPSTRWRGRPCH